MVAHAQMGGRGTLSTGEPSEYDTGTVDNSSSWEVTFQKCLISGITLFSSKNSNKPQTLATGAYQRLHEAGPCGVVWLWEPERDLCAIWSMVGETGAPLETYFLIFY